MKELHKELQHKREAKGFSLQELGHLVGCTPTYIERIELGDYIPKPEVARRLAQALEEPEERFLEWSQQRGEEQEDEAPRKPTPRYPEARAALVALCKDPDQAKQLFRGSSIGPLEAALYGLLIDRMSHHMADMGFWGFLSPKEDNEAGFDSRLLLEAFFEMLVHPEGEMADYHNVFSRLLESWRYGPGPHRITVVHPDETETTYRLALVDREGSIIPALEPEDPFHALYRMLTASQRKDLADITRVLLRHENRLEIQAALQALSRWHDL